MNLINVITAKLRHLFVILLFVFTAILPAQAALSENYQYDTWTSRDGLPHNSINAITQTEDGYLWFATWEGIARFNGKEFKVFTRGSASGLIDSGVRALYADNDGSLFAGGSRGDFWLTSNRGIWRITKQEANAVADGLQSEINFIHYGELDGMPTA
ncbi:MAG: ligand-binding sensor domain-containing protein [Psychromonas sp.]|jgi:ligand-binding sensor domain-containing protein|uniref:ligand-binding sensor domain-containing protein n=1 Tax=Psychromonas sp. TaxID=1884585 RepID=UPI0039E6AFCA